MAKFESKQLVCAIETLNSTLVANMTSHYTLSHVTPKDSLYEITPYLAACGLTQPLLQVYNTFKVGVLHYNILSVKHSLNMPFLDVVLCYFIFSCKFLRNIVTYLV